MPTPAPQPEPALRVALLADTHGSLDGRIEQLVGDCDLAVHAGDIGNAAVLARLQPRQGRVLAVYGNNDSPRQWPSADRELLQHLPEWRAYPLPGGTLVVIHGHQTPARDRHGWLRRRFPEARVLVYGHSHRLVVDTDVSPWVLNPGAAGRTRTHGGPSCLILEARTSTWTVEVHRFTHHSHAPRARIA
ncbi:YfcE family phosphodiesterase [Marichromatium sp. PS1]|uniref:metallophosphoesterase family protein n=1 Tax=Marichromatium sp. PS1 TaxID=3138932 RepID=UPI0032E56040